MKTHRTREYIKHLKIVEWSYAILISKLPTELMKANLKEPIFQAILVRDTTYSVN